MIFRDELSTSINGLKWIFFENLCSFILEIYGFKNSAITKRSRDGGLDFLGVLDPFEHENSYLGFLKNCNLRIFGQSKQRSNKVSEEEIRVFYSHYLARAQTGTHTGSGLRVLGLEFVV